MHLPNEKPNKALMTQLRDVAKKAAGVGTALRQVNHIPTEFPEAEMGELIKSLTGLPEGTAGGAFRVLNPASQRLLDIKLDFFLTDEEADERETEAQKKGTELPPSIRRDTNLDTAFDKLIGSAFAALNLCYTQKRIERPEPVHEEQIVTNDNAAAQTSKTQIIMAQSALQAQQKIADDLLNQAKVSANDADRDRLSRRFKDAQNISHVTRAELSFPRVRRSVIKGLSKSLAAVPKLIRGAAKAIAFTTTVAEPVLKAFNDWTSTVAESGLKAVKDASTGVMKAMDNWEKEQKQSRQNNILTEPPEVDPEIQKAAEEKAVTLIRENKQVLRNIGQNVRDLAINEYAENDGESFYDFELLRNCPWLQSLYISDTQINNLESLRDYKYLKGIDISKTNISDISPLTHLKKLGSGPINFRDSHFE